MANKDDAASAEATWLPVIGRTLAFLCMQAVDEQKKFASVLERVDFLEGLGLPPADAARAAGSSKASVDELRRLARNRKAGNGKAKKTRKRRS
jgi:hypothetical protein